MNKKLLLAICLLFVGVQLFAQDDEYPYPSLSPKGKLIQQIGNTLLEIEYERPSARKRLVFGGLVPWNNVWRTGAGYCTKIKVNTFVKIEGQNIPAGTYAVFSIPNPIEWVIILNRDTTLYGSSFYDSQEDVARFIVLPQKSSRHYETLNFDIELIANDAQIYLSWQNTQVSFKVETLTDEFIAQFIQDELLSGNSKNADWYAGAAEYYLYQGSNLLTAIKLADRALEIEENNGWAINLKIKLYEKLKLYNEALLEVNRAIEMVKKEEYEKEEYRERELKSLKQDYQRIEQKMKK